MTILLRGDCHCLALAALPAQHLALDDAHVPEGPRGRTGCLDSVFQSPTEGTSIAGRARQAFVQLSDALFQFVQTFGGTPDPLPSGPLVQELENAL